MLFQYPLKWIEETWLNNSRVVNFSYQSQNYATVPTVPNLTVSLGEAQKRIQLKKIVKTSF